MLFSLYLPRVRKTLQMRWYPYFSIYAMLCLMFVVPHDPSTSLYEIGSVAFSVSATRLHRWQAFTSELSQQRALRHATPVSMTGTRSVFLGRDASTSSRDLLRLLRLAQARPQLVLRIASAALVASATGRPDELLAAVNESELGWGTTVEELRAEYGERQRWWGDLTPSETRALYHALLPTSLLKMESATADAPYTLQERAELAIAARKAAKQYARERTLLPFAVGCALLDGMRQLLAGGSFRSSGLSEEQIWQKYAGCLPSDLPDGAAFDDDVYMTILRKACSTNRYVDMVCGASTWSVDVSEAAKAASERL